MHMRGAEWSQNASVSRQGFGESMQASFVGDLAVAGILSLVARERGVPVGLLLHKSRCAADVAEARQLAMYLMHVVLQRPMTEIGAFFGRDRTTVSHACHCVEDKRDDAAFDGEVIRLEAAIDEITGSLPKWLARGGVAHAA